MSTRIPTLAKSLALLSLFVLFTAGCGRSVTRVRVAHPREAQIVVVQNAHVHSARCGHYRHDNTWYFVKGHVHGAACGHVKVKGVWVIR
jgi:hypothetical protein